MNPGNSIARVSSIVRIRPLVILLMTPHIISDQFKSDDVTREFKEKVEGMRKQLEEKEKKEKERKEKKEK